MILIQRQLRFKNKTEKSHIANDDGALRFKKTFQN